MSPWRLWRERLLPPKFSEPAIKLRLQRVVYNAARLSEVADLVTPRRQLGARDATTNDCGRWLA